MYVMNNFNGIHLVVYQRLRVSVHGKYPFKVMVVMQTWCYNSEVLFMGNILRV